MFSAMLAEKQVARDIESSILTGCLLRCGRIDRLIGEQSRFVSQEYRAFGWRCNRMPGHIGSSVVNRENEQRKADLLMDRAGPTRCPYEEKLAIVNRAQI